MTRVCWRKKLWTCISSCWIFQAVVDWRGALLKRGDLTRKFLKRIVWAGILLKRIVLTGALLKMVDWTKLFKRVVLLGTLLKRIVLTWELYIKDGLCNAAFEKDSRDRDIVEKDSLYRGII